MAEAQKALSEVRVEGVTCVFGSTAALRNVSAEFVSGEVCLLTGHNGAGKTTLLAVIGGLLKPTRGRVRYGKLGEGDQRARSSTGWIGHDGHGYRELSGRENVSLMARLQGVATEAIDEAIARVDASSFADRPLGTLSRGQRQRMALARALVHEPSILLLDEPWSGLDKGSSERLETIVLEEKARGAVVVCVTHDLSVRERLGARELRLSKGRVVA